MALTQVQGGMVASGTITSNNVSFAANSISGSALTANTVSNTAFQTGSVENYMSAQGFGIGMRNRIINGDMRIDQRNAGASVTNVTSGGFTYTIDRWGSMASQASKFNVQQNAGSVTPPAGFSNYVGITSASAYSVGSTEFFSFGQVIEGLNAADFQWGTANAASVAVSFWVRSSLTGTFGAYLKGYATAAMYPFTYTISSANTWTYVTVSVPAPTSVSFPAVSNTQYFFLAFDLGSGSSNKATPNGSWQAVTTLGVTGATSVVGTNGATFYITGVQLEKGSVATPFEYRQYGAELALCQRYFVSYGAGSSDSGSSTFAGYWAETTIVQASAATPVPMRSSPTITLLNPTTAMSVYRPGTSQAAPGAGASATEITQTGFILNSGICSSSSTQGFGTHWRCYGSGKVIASAEL